MINPGLLVAGGVGALGVGFLLTRDSKPKDGVDPSTKDITPAAPGAPGAPGTPGAAAPAVPGPATGQVGGTPGGFPGASPTVPGTAMQPGSPQQPLPAGARQVGEFTIIPDASGSQVVFETATQQPVAVLDQQGNTVGVVRDGQLVPVAQQPAATTAAPGGAVPGVGAPAGPSLPGAASGAAAGYAGLAESLFAGAGDASVGSAASDAVQGQGTIAPQPFGLQPQPQPQPYGAFTLVADPASGQQLVVETATGTAIGTLAPTGAFTPAG